MLPAAKKTKPVDYYNSRSVMPYMDYGIRPSMILSANSIDAVKRLIDRGVAADYLRPKSSAYLISTSDKERNVRAAHYPLIKKSLEKLLNIELMQTDAIKNKQDVMFYFTGMKQVKYINTNKYVFGAMADHLTSTGGHLFKGAQMSVLNWIDAGATGTYGTVVEPCNFKQKFPNPGIVMQKYLSGNSLIEAYWKSVQMPGQGLFVGEPLSTPYGNCGMWVNKDGVFNFYKNKPENLVEKKFRNCN